MLVERVSAGFYLHYKGDVYYVESVGILDEDGHGNVNAPRQVIYQSFQSQATGLRNIKSEQAFLELVEWPDGVTRPKFQRIEKATWGELALVRGPL